MNSVSYITPLMRGISLALVAFVFIFLVSSCTQEPLAVSDQTDVASMCFLKDKSPYLQNSSDENSSERSDYLAEALAARSLIESLREGQYHEMSFDALSPCVGMVGRLGIVAAVSGVTSSFGTLP